MTLGQKLKQIRKKFGLSQEQLAEIMCVSRQAVTKWENDLGMPDTVNLQALSKIFGITIDYLLSNENTLPKLVMRKELDKTKYSNKISSYSKILKEYYPAPWQIYTLIRTDKMNKMEWLFEILSGTLYSIGKSAANPSPYYLVKKDELKLMVNIQDWCLVVTELPDNINEKKFIIGKNIYRKSSPVKL